MMSNFHRGDRVIVPWGLDEVDGVVVDLFGPVTDPVVTVRVELDGPHSEGEDIGFRASQLRHVEVDVEAPP